MKKKILSFIIVGILIFGNLQFVSATDNEGFFENIWAGIKSFLQKIGILEYWIYGYQDQCYLSSCPSGYTETDLYCETDTKKCYRECTASGGCGSYGSFQRVKSKSVLGWSGALNRGNLYYTSSYSVGSTSYCYKYYTKTEFDVKTWSWPSTTADSFELWSFVYQTDGTAMIGASKKGCFSDPASYGHVTTSIVNLGRGGKPSVDYIEGAAQVYDYGLKYCSGERPVTPLKGDLNIYLYVAKASYTEGDTITRTCSYECARGDDKCVGTTYYICNDDWEWESQGQVEGECGYIECTPHASKYCWDNNIYWYNSCGNREEKATDCGTDGYIGSKYCGDDGNVHQEYRYYMCNPDAVSCFTSDTDKIVESCISGYFCDENTLTCVLKLICQSNADSNDDGTVDRIELGVYIDKWKVGTKTRIKLGQAIQDWVDGC